MILIYFALFVKNVHTRERKQEKFVVWKTFSNISADFFFFFFCCCFVCLFVCLFVVKKVVRKQRNQACHLEKTSSQYRHFFHIPKHTYIYIWKDVHRCCFDMVRYRAACYRRVVSCNFCLAILKSNKKSLVIFRLSDTWINPTFYF